MACTRPTTSEIEAELWFRNVPVDYNAVESASWDYCDASEAADALAQTYRREQEDDRRREEEIREEEEYYERMEEARMEEKRMEEEAYFAQLEQLREREGGL